MAIIAEVAKVLVGALAFDVLSHIGFLISKSEPKWFGLKLTKRFNIAAAVTNTIVLFALVYIAWFARY